ncbi:MAG TPA: A24 family peptidase [Candidatus Limnocylindrales bacterium]
MPDALGLAFGAVGLAWGVVSDRIAARWPEHEDGANRQIDWRTAVVAVVGAVAFGVLPGRFGVGPDLALFGAYFVALVLLFATDLDQRLLPDIVTIPLVPLAFLAAATGIDPLVRGELIEAIGVAIVVPALLFALARPFGEGAIGIGDLKLLVSVGLLAGLTRTIVGVVSGALLGGAVVLVLLVTRRVSLHSYIPFGPFLIVGAMWGIVGPG